MAPSDDTPLPIAVLVSGSGSNLQAIIDAAARPGYGAAIAVGALAAWYFPLFAGAPS